jgi:hypothetical protein
MTIFMGTANAAAGMLSTNLSETFYLKPTSALETFWLGNLSDTIERTTASQLYANNYVETGSVITNVAWHTGGSTAVPGNALRIKLVPNRL